MSGENPPRPPQKLIPSPEKMPPRIERDEAGNRVTEVEFEPISTETSVSRERREPPKGTLHEVVDSGTLQIESNEPEEARAIPHTSKNGPAALPPMSAEEILESQRQFIAESKRENERMWAEQIGKELNFLETMTPEAGVLAAEAAPAQPEQAPRMKTPERAQVRTSETSKKPEAHHANAHPTGHDAHGEHHGDDHPHGKKVGLLAGGLYGAAGILLLLMLKGGEWIGAVWNGFMGLIGVKGSGKKESKPHKPAAAAHHH